jgi:hypothetical protein
MGLLRLWIRLAKMLASLLKGVRAILSRTEHFLKPKRIRYAVHPTVFLKKSPLIETVKKFHKFIEPKDVSVFTKAHHCGLY